MSKVVTILAELAGSRTFDLLVLLLLAIIVFYQKRVTAAIREDLVQIRNQLGNHAAARRTSSESDGMPSGEQSMMLLSGADTARPRSIHFFCTTLRENEFYPRLLQEILRRADEEKINLSLRLSNVEREPGRRQHDSELHAASLSNALEFATEERAVAVMIPPSPSNYYQVDEALRRLGELTVVSLDVPIPDTWRQSLFKNPRFRLVRLDSKRSGAIAAKEAMQYFRQKRIDARKVNYVLCAGEFHGRHEFFRAEIDKRCAPDDEHTHVVDVPFNRRDSYEIMKEFILDLIQDLPAEEKVLVFCPNDNITLGVHDALSELHWAEKLQQFEFMVIGFDAVDSTRRLVDTHDPFLIGCVDHNYDVYARHVLLAVREMIDVGSAGGLKPVAESEIVVRPGFYKPG